jgi:hypothetical protein
MHTSMTELNITYLWNIDMGDEELEVWWHPGSVIQVTSN